MMVRSTPSTIHRSALIAGWAVADVRCGFFAVVTQARHEGEIDDMAREFIALVLDVPVDDIAVSIHWRDHD
jgi:hypothetical protein